MLIEICVYYEYKETEIPQNERSILYLRNLKKCEKRK